MFFDDWHGIWRIAAVGIPAYLLLVAMLRVSGKRTLAKMNAFDLVVTVALGSTLATILLSPDIAFAEGMTGFAVLIGMQLLIALGAVLSTAVRDFAKSTPRALLVDGVIDEAALRDERVTREEVLQALRSDGRGAVEDVAAVVLETDGSLSVIGRGQAGTRSALTDVRGAGTPAGGGSGTSRQG